MAKQIISPSHPILLAGIYHQELHSVFYQGLQVTLQGLPPDVYADFLRHASDAEQALAALSISENVLAEFRQAVDSLKSQKSFDSPLETEQQVHDLIDESVATAIRLDQAMGRVREQLSAAESVMYAVGICSCAVAVNARLVLSGPIVFSNLEEADPSLRQTYVLLLNQIGEIVENFLSSPDYAEVFQDRIPHEYVEDLGRMTKLIADNPSIPDSTARAIQQIVDTRLESIGYETIFVRLFANLSRAYATDTAFQIDLLQLMASLFAQNKDEFNKKNTFAFGVAPPWEGSKVFAGAREATAFLNAFKFTPELLWELTWNPLFSREDLASSIKNRLRRIPNSWTFSSQFKKEGEPIGPDEFYGFFSGPAFLYRLVAKTIVRICEFQIHIATRAKYDPDSMAGGPPINIPEGARLLPPNDWGYQLSYINPSRLFSPTHSAWSGRARHAACIARHTIPGFIEYPESSGLSFPDAWDVDSHAVAIAKGVGRKLTEPKLTEADKAELYKSGIRALQPIELYGDHLSAYLFDASHDYVSQSRDDTADHRLYRDNVLNPPTEFLVDSYYQSTFLPSRLVPAALYGKDDHKSTNCPIMRARHKRIPISTARTVEELSEIVEQSRESLPGGKTLLYRGQTKHFRIMRSERVREFLYGSSKVNELSLTATASRANFPFESFLARFQLYLQGLLYRDIPAKAFDKVTPEESRHRWPFSDPYLSMVYRKWSEIYCESQWDVLATGLAQHYGIPTNGLDLTESLHVAIWFALHEMWGFDYRNRRCHWYKPRDEWVAEGDDRPVIYLIATDIWLPRHLDELQDKLPLPQALRPERQSAYLHFGGWGLQSNICAEDVVHAIFLAPEFRTTEQFATADLFPDRREDDFYDALLELKAKTAGGLKSIRGYEAIIEFLEPPEYYRHPVAASQTGAGTISAEVSGRERPSSNEKIVGDAKALGELLFNAVNMKRFEEAFRLLEAGANVNFKGQKDVLQGGGTPLHWAALHGNVELVRRLIERGANINAMDNVGRTPLFPAAANGHVEVLKLLLAYGADVRAMNYRGWRLIPPSLRHPEIVKLLNEYGFRDERSIVEMPVQRRRLSKRKLIAILKRDVTEWNAMRRTMGDLELDLSGAHLARADLIGVNLSGAVLIGASFVEANLMGADLQNTDLNQADFTFATISEVNFSGATNLDKANLANVYWDKKPKWPEGFNLKNIDKR